MIVLPMSERFLSRLDIGDSYKFYDSVEHDPYIQLDDRSCEAMERYFEMCRAMLDINILPDDGLVHPQGRFYQRCRGSLLRDYNGGWKALENALGAGKVRAIGISDFDFDDEIFNSIVEPARIKPQMFQIECHPYAQREHWQEIAKKYDIKIECWFPLGGRDSHGEILRDPVINEIAKAHGKSAAQVIIRWHIQKGFCVVPGSSNPKHIQENIEVFDFELSQEEMAKMASLNQEKRYFNMTYQQIKAWMENYELWD